jgi:hypothetical protein
LKVRSAVFSLATVASDDLTLSTKVWETLQAFATALLLHVTHSASDKKTLKNLQSPV